jgi:ABC-2 type transport system permease protein
MRKTFLREWRLLLADPDRILIVILAPLAYIAIYGTVFLTPNVERVEMGVVDRDGGALSRRLTLMLDADPVLHTVEYTDPDRLRDDLERRRITAAAIIPPGWEETLKSRDQARLEVQISTTNFLMGNEANKHIQTVLETFNAGLTVNSLRTAGIPPVSALHRVQSAAVVLISVGNPSYAYGMFLTFAVLMLIVHQMLLIGMTQAVATEREHDRLADLNAAARGRVVPMLLGKVAPYCILFAITFLFEVSGPFRWLGLEQRGSIPAQMLFVTPMLLTLTGMGVVIGSSLNSRAQALQVVGITSAPILLISGVMWPWDQMPAVFRWISYALPTRPMLAGVQAMSQLGSIFREQAPLFLTGCAQAVFWLGLAAWRIRRVTRIVPTEPVEQP